MACGRCVLVVDDDADIREVLGELLADAGCAVATAENGAHALSYLERHPSPCFLLLDLHMPVLDGPGFLAELAARPAVDRFPIVVQSAEPMPPPLGVPVLRKPVSLAVLLNLLRLHCPAPCSTLG